MKNTKPEYFNYKKARNYKTLIPNVCNLIIDYSYLSKVLLSNTRILRDYGDCSK